MIFDGTNTTASNDLSGVNAAGIQFNAAAGAFTLSGNGITLSTALNNLSPNTQTLNLPITLGGGNLPVNVLAGNVVINGQISDNGSPQTITLNGPGAHLERQQQHLQRRHGAGRRSAQPGQCLGPWHGSR